MLETRSRVRPLVPGDQAELMRLTAADPWAHVFMRHRVTVTGLEPRWMAGQVLGHFVDGVLTAVCHVGANIVPAEADEAAALAFADRIIATTLRPSSISGPRSSVMAMWERLEPHWGPARSPRLHQPFLVIDHDSAVESHPWVRPVAIDELDLLEPASIRMFTEEVGVHPGTGPGQQLAYRARLAQVIAAGWAFALIEDGRLLFKAEVGAATPEACQIQGVWVDPEVRGRGLAAPALAAVVEQVRRAIAPVVTLYVNDHNIAARRAYERVGFRQHTTFASILF